MFTQPTNCLVPKSFNSSGVKNIVHEKGVITFTYPDLSMRGANYFWYNKVVRETFITLLNQVPSNDCLLTIGASLMSFRQWLQCMCHLKNLVPKAYWSFYFSVPEELLPFLFLNAWSPPVTLFWATRPLKNRDWTSPSKGRKILEHFKLEILHGSTSHRNKMYKY